MKRSRKHDIDDLKRLRAETHRVYWATRFMQCLTILACVAVIDLLTRWHAPQLREDVLRTILNLVR